MVGVADRDPLRMAGVSVTPLRMVGAAGSGSVPADRRGLGRGQSRLRGGPAGHWPPAAIAARISARRYSAYLAGVCHTAAVTSSAGRGSITPTAT